MTKLQEIRIVNHNESVTDAVVFEVVGKFTSGCDTSESERDGSSDYEEEEEDEEYEDFDEDDEAAPPPQVGNGNEDGTTPNAPLPPHARVSIEAKWLPTWRRQSIA